MGRIVRFLIASLLGAMIVNVSGTPAIAMGGGLTTTFYQTYLGSLPTEPYTGSSCFSEVGILNYSWGGYSPGGSCGGSNFSDYSSGYIKGPVSGTVTFCDQSDDAFYLKIDGTPVINNWTAQGAAGVGPAGPCNGTGTFTMVLGQIYQIQVWHNQGGGGADLRLLWSYAGQSKIIVPSDYLGVGLGSFSPGYITGTNRVGFVLTAGAIETGTVVNPALVHYVWKIANSLSDTFTVIESQTADTYTVRNSDLGKYIKVIQTLPDGTVYTSPPTDVIKAAVEVPIAVVSLSGYLQMGYVLSLDTGGTTGFPTPTFTYSWESSANPSGPWTAIPGETDSTLILRSYGAEVNKYIRGSAVAQNSSMSPSTARAVTSAPISDNRWMYMAASRSWRPNSDSTMQSTFYTNAGLNAYNVGPTSVTFQWSRSSASDGTFTPISGATGSTYVPTDYLVDLNSWIKVSETANYADGSSRTFVSDPAQILDDRYLGVKISGASGNVRSVITADVTPSNNIDPNAVTYQWKRSTTNGANAATGSFANIPGSAGTAKNYTIGSNEAGYCFYVVANASLVRGNFTSTSNTICAVNSYASFTPLAGVNLPGLILDLEASKYTGVGPWKNLANTPGKNYDATFYSGNFKGYVNKVWGTGGVIQSDGSAEENYVDIPIPDLESNSYTLIIASHYLDGANQGRILKSFTTDFLLGSYQNCEGGFYSNGWVQGMYPCDTSWNVSVASRSMASGFNRFYFNGQLQRKNANAPVGPGGGLRLFGGYQSSGGQISYVLAYSRVLTDAEIAKVYNAIGAQESLSVMTIPSLKSRSVSFPSTNVTKFQSDAPFYANPTFSSNDEQPNSNDDGILTYYSSGSACTVNPTTGLISSTGFIGSCTVTAQITGGITYAASSGSMTVNVVKHGT